MTEEKQNQALLVHTTMIGTTSFLCMITQSYFACHGSPALFLFCCFLFYFFTRRYLLIVVRLFVFFPPREMKRTRHGLTLETSQRMFHRSPPRTTRLVGAFASKIKNERLNIHNGRDDTQSESCVDPCLLVSQLFVAVTQDPRGT